MMIFGKLLCCRKSEQWSKVRMKGIEMTRQRGHVNYLPSSCLLCSTCHHVHVLCLYVCENSIRMPTPNPSGSPLNAIPNPIRNSTKTSPHHPNAHYLIRKFPFSQQIDFRRAPGYSYRDKKQLHEYNKFTFFLILKIFQDLIYERMKEKSSQLSG